MGLCSLCVNISNEGNTHHCINGDSYSGSHTAGSNPLLPILFTYYFAIHIYYFFKLYIENGKLNSSEFNNLFRLTIQFKI